MHRAATGGRRRRRRPAGRRPSRARARAASSGRVITATAPSRLSRNPRGSRRAGRRSAQRPPAATPAPTWPARRQAEHRHGVGADAEPDERPGQGVAIPSQQPTSPVAGTPPCSADQRSQVVGAAHHRRGAGPRVSRAPTGRRTRLDVDPAGLTAMSGAAIGHHPHVPRDRRRHRADAALGDAGRPAEPAAGEGRRAGRPSRRVVPGGCAGCDEQRARRPRGRTRHRAAGRRRRPRRAPRRGPGRRRQVAGVTASSWSDR